MSAMKPENTAGTRISAHTATATPAMPSTLTQRDSR
jgi:hypothetical protein